MEQILRLFPVHIKRAIEKSRILLYEPEEIRVRVNEYLAIHTRDGRWYLKDGKPVRQPESGCIRITAEDIEQICAFMSRYSLYAYEEEIRQGFLTVEGGHRIGVCGKVSCESGKIRRIAPISYLNIRIAAQKIDCAMPVLPQLMEDGMFCDTVLLSAPGAGKTTLLRDLVRLLSNGTLEYPASKVALVDERSEIAGCRRGVPQNEIGRNTDVLDACPKTEGMMLMIRSMSPQILAVDEIGRKEDLDALRYASFCGLRLLTSVHAGSFAELSDKPFWKDILSGGMFSRFVEIRVQDNRRVYRVLRADGAMVQC